MKIKSVSIKNFRGIEKLDDPIKLSDFNVFIGDNATCKTTVIEAVNFCLSPRFTASRLSVNDFYKGGDKEIEIIIEFEENFIAKLPDGYTTQDVECNKVILTAKKREKAAAQKAFSDLVTTTHYVMPVATRGEEGWSQSRKTSSNDFKFTERQLSFPVPEVELPISSRARYTFPSFWLKPVNSSISSNSNFNHNYVKTTRNTGYRCF